MSDPQGLVRLATIHEPVYKALNAATFYGEYHGEPVVVKQADASLQREAATLRSIDDTHIPKVVDYITDSQDVQFLILEHMAGIPLDKYIYLNAEWHSSALPAAESITIVDSLALCFSALQKAGFLYRDLNLGHVLVKANGVSLVDHEWDVPVNESGTAVVDSLAGTWETMAPEEYQIGNHMTEASSVYTLGCVLLQLLNGSTPFFISEEEIPDAKIRRNATYGRMKNFSTITASDTKLNSVVNKALQPDPTQRYQTINEFRQALRHAA